MCHMRRFLERDPSDSRNRAEPRFHASILDLVIPSIYEQSGNFDVVRLLPALPVFEVANNCEFGRPLPNSSEY